MIHDRMFMEDDLENFDPSMMDSSEDALLDLLCEDGFLEPEELAQAETPEKQKTLIRLAIERGFPLTWDEERLETEGKLIVKKLDSLRVWKDLVHDDLRLRAPPEMCAA